MGNKYYIRAWGQHNQDWMTNPMERVDPGYSDKEMWRGQSLLQALYMLWKIKRQGWGCVTLECR